MALFASLDAGGIRKVQWYIARYLAAAGFKGVQPLYPPSTKKRSFFRSIVGVYTFKKVYLFYKQKRHIILLLLLVFLRY